MKSTLYIEELENKLMRNFDLHRDYKIDNEVYDLFARYYLRSEKYFLTKSAKIYGMESNEYILVKKMVNLDNGSFDLFTSKIIAAIDMLVEPHDEHMTSIVTGVILIDKQQDEIDDKLLKRVSKFKYHKGFSLGLKGWVDVRIVLVSLKDGLIIANKKGKEVSEVYSIHQ